MVSLTFASLLILAGLILFGVRAVSSTTASRATFGGFGVLALVLGVLALIIASAVYVPDNETGVIVRTLGKDLPAGRIIAQEGEKGPQAQVLGPGWHFGYWPWSYEVNKVDIVQVPNGSVGLVTALDGRALPEGMVYAPAWPSADAMLDAAKFLESKEGYRGPQLTILAPGNYRLNPRLFRVEMRPFTLVQAGEVAVVKANAGPIYTGTDKLVVNGVDIVPQGYRGIWRQPLTPGAYNLHSDAYQVLKVKTTQRVYTYQRVDRTDWRVQGKDKIDQAYDDSLSVRSKDGFTFPVDLRLSLSIAAENAPYLVALLGNPDQITKDVQEGEELETLEARLVFPAVRAALRNVAENLGALEFIANRSKVEVAAAKYLEAELTPYHLAFDGAYIGAIGLDATEAGRQLILTQTEKEVAANQKATYQQQEQAELARRQLIRAREEAEQQKNLVEAGFAVKNATRRAKAQAESAKGEADMIRITSEARKQSYELLSAAIGAQGVTLLESLRLVREGNIRITPDVLVQGGATGDVNDALAATLLKQYAKPAAAKSER